MTEPSSPPFFIVHVDAPIIIANRERHRNDPVVMIRLSICRGKILRCRQAKIYGPSRLVHKPNEPLPGTNGQGVSWCETRSQINAFRDEGGPIDLDISDPLVARHFR